MVITFDACDSSSFPLRVSCGIIVQKSLEIYYILQRFSRSGRPAFGCTSG